MGDDLFDNILKFGPSASPADVAVLAKVFTMVSSSNALNSGKKTSKESVTLEYLRENKTLSSWEDFKSEGILNVESSDFPLSLSALVELAKIEAKDSAFRFYVNSCFDKDKIRNYKSFADWKVLIFLVPNISKTIKEKIFLSNLEDFANDNSKISLNDIPYVLDCIDVDTVKNLDLKKRLVNIKETMAQPELLLKSAVIFNIQKSWGMNLQLPTVDGGVSYSNTARVETFINFLMGSLTSNKKTLESLGIESVKRIDTNEYLFTLNDGVTLSPFKSMFDDSVFAIKEWCASNLNDDGWYFSSNVVPSIKSIWIELINKVMLKFIIDSEISQNVVVVSVDNAEGEDLGDSFKI